MITITSGMAAKLATDRGTEPINVVVIDWLSGGTSYYADRAINFGAHACNGGIVEFSAINSQARADSLGETSGGTVTLDDTDGVLKTKIDEEEIEGSTVSCYHYYEGLAEADAVLLLKGKLAAEITWSEGERLLTFSIQTAGDANELGFALEDGDLPLAHESAIGKVWPLAFGTALKIPAVQVYKYTVGKLRDVFESTDSSVEVDGGLNFPQSSLITIDIGLIRCTGTMVNNTFTFTSKNISHGSGPITGRLPLDDDYTNPAVFWYNGTTKLFGKYVYVNDPTYGYMVNKCIQEEGSKKYFIKPWRPSGTSERVQLTTGASIVEIAGAPRASWTADMTIEATSVHDELGVTVYSFLSTVTTYLPDTYSVSQGSLVRHISGISGEKYVANAIPSTAILEVYGRRTLNGVPLFVPIPSSYYSASLNDSTFFNATTLTFSAALNEYFGENWENDIYVSVESSQGPNVADVIKYIIETYTSYTVDATTYASVAAIQANWPVGFAYFNKADAIRVAQEIAWQARCALLLRNGIVYIKYLSTLPTGSEPSLDEADVLEKSLSLGFTDTDDLTTRFRVDWVQDYSGEEDSTHTLRYENNIASYGPKTEDSLSFYIYNIEELIQLSLGFWGYRYSNSWRRLNCSLLMGQLGHEALDVVEFDMTTLSSNAINGQLETVQYDSNNMQLDLEVLLASLTGGGGNPDEDEDFWLGDPAAAYRDLYSYVAGDIGTGLSTIDYYPEHDDVDGGADYNGREPGRLSLSIVASPAYVDRGTNFLLQVTLVDEDGNIHLNDENVTLELLSSDSGDVLNTTTSRIENGTLSLSTLQITGGSGSTDTGLIRVISTRYGDVSTETFDLRDSGSSLAWGAQPREVIRDQQFTVSISGSPSATVTVALIATNGSDQLYDSSGLVTTILLDSSGEFSANDWYITGGSGDEDTALLSVTDGGTPAMSSRFPVLDTIQNQEVGIPIVSIYGSVIPAYSAMQVVSVDSNGVHYVTRPTGDNLHPAVVLFSREAITGYVWDTYYGYSPYQHNVQTAYDSSFYTPTVNDILGTQEDSFELKTGNYGFSGVSRIGGQERVAIRPDPSYKWHRIYNDSGSGVSRGSVMEITDLDADGIFTVDLPSVDNLSPAKILVALTDISAASQGYGVFTYDTLYPVIPNGSPVVGDTVGTAAGQPYLEKNKTGFYCIGEPGSYIYVKPTGGSGGVSQERSVYNVSGADIPANSIVRISDYNPTTDVYSVAKVNADHMCPAELLVIKDAILTGASGTGYDPFGPTLEIAVATAAAVGDTFGTVNATWTLEKNYVGFKCNRAGASTAYFRPF